MHPIVKILVPLILAIAVFGSAKYLDENPRKIAAKESEETVAATETAEQETLAVPVTEAATVPVETEAPTELPTEASAQQERFQITFVGDCTLGTGLNSYYADVGFVKTVGNDYGYPFQNVIDYFTSDELTLLNLEGPLTDVGNPTEKQHTFRGPTEFVGILTENSVEAVNLANNHVQDYGPSGYRTTVSVLKEENISYVEQDDSSIITTKNGLKIGLFGAVYYKLDTEKIVDGIASLKEQGCDLVIFAPHWGTEGAYRATPEQINLAHAVIDAGADIVWGTHPHVLQPIEEYNGGVIFYSLGNFSFGGNTDPGDYDTALLQQELIRDAEGNLSLGELTIVPASVSSESGRNNFQPTPYESGTKEYDRVLRKLNGSWDGPDITIQ